MSFTVTWHELLPRIDELSEDATMVTPLSHRRFRIAETQDQRVIISFDDEDGYQPLQRDQFESLYRRIHDEPQRSTSTASHRTPPPMPPY